MDLDLTKKPRHDSENHPPPGYKECMKNHAAAIGGHAVDGCGEFLPSAASLKCAACGCHRSFHRLDPPDCPATPPFLDFRRPVPAGYNGPRAFFGAAEEKQRSPVKLAANNTCGRKRFRTKFSREQKEKMLSFSVRLGWKVRRCDEAAVKELCHEIGVSKEVLKVWMHNNKNVFVKRDTNNGGFKQS